MLFLDMAVNFAVLSIRVPMEIESQGESGCRVSTFSFFFSFFFFCSLFFHGTKMDSRTIDIRARVFLAA